MICVTMCKSALAGAVPVRARQFPTGTILVDSPAHTVGAAVAYCRVSSAEQRADLERQAGRVAGECGTRGITLAATITEIGSGVFGNRAKRQKLPDGAVSVVRAAYRFALDPTPRSRTWCLRSLRRAAVHVQLGPGAGES